MSKYVENWWVEKLENGVIHLLINTTQREIYYHRFNDKSYLICGSEEEYDEHPNDCILEIPEFIPRDNNIWIPTSMKEKDQLSFYFIPYQRAFKRKKNVILKSK